MASSTTSSGSSSDPWAWLGLLKWSLSYSDGTKPSSTTPMSDEDKAFLEAVMREGIIDENERMKKILKEVTALMEQWTTSKYTQDEEDTVLELLEQLRDIVEQIDYARAFAAMKGLVFLLGCIGEREHMPKSIRAICLGLLSTLAQNNPHVQKELLELGAIRTLSDIYFVEDDNRAETDADGQLRARIMQAVSSIVRSYELGESVFCQLEQSVRLLELGLGIGRSVNATGSALCKRTLFFLHALVTSDASTRDRVRRFQTCISWVADNLLDAATEENVELREMALALLIQVLEQRKRVNAILSRKDAVAALGVRRVASLRALTNDDDREYAAVELEQWERLLVLLARATPDETTSGSSPMLLEDGGSNDSLAQ